MDNNTALVITIAMIFLFLAYSLSLIPKAPSDENGSNEDANLDS